MSDTSHTLRPLSDHVIVRPIRSTSTPSGIVIPDTAQDAKTDRGEVIAVGPGRLLENGTRAPMDVSVGDRVLFAKYAADTVSVGDDDLLILAQSDIQSVIL